MTRTTLLSDELLGQLVAVGQVDILVGVPTLDNASTVGKVVRAVHESFARRFVRERTVLINCDGGSTDGTPEIVRGASLREDETLIASSTTLRTIHRISAPYRGVPGKGTAVRTLFAAADLLQARAVAVFDPDVTSIGPEWPGRLIGPVWEGRADFVAPAFPRPPQGSLLVTQLVAPLVASAYGRGFHDPVAGEFACTGAFASRCLASDAWSSALGQVGLELWLPLEALASGGVAAQAALPARLTAPGIRPALPEMFRQIVGSLFTCLERHAPYCVSKGATGAVPLIGQMEAVTEGSAADPGPMLESFRAGVPALAPILETIIEGSTWDELRRLAAAPGLPHFSDALWAATVCQLAAAHRLGRMHREHIVQALVPLYLGRAASFLTESAGCDATAVRQRQESLDSAFGAARTELFRGVTAGILEVSHD